MCVSVQSESALKYLYNFMSISSLCISKQLESVLNRKEGNDQESI